LNETDQILNLEKELQDIRQKKSDIEQNRAENYKKWETGQLPFTWKQDILRKQSELTRRENEIMQKLSLLQCDTKREQSDENWDDYQISVIQAEPNSRIIVDAGPGTGKTAVACARAAWMIKNRNIKANTILILSFTRAAVHEIRSRIRANFQKVGLNPDLSRSVSISTQDSYAFALRKSKKENSWHGTYDDNIRLFLEDLKNEEGFGGLHLEKNVRHLIVDEAQDIMGERSQLLIEFFRRLSPECGVTVFSDDAQAIYGFTQRNKNLDKITLSDIIKNDKTLNFSHKSLETVYRTKNQHLISLFTVIRKKVLKMTGTPDEYTELLKDVYRCAGKKSPDVRSPELDSNNNCFILYRNRANVLKASYDRKTAPHRIRLPNLPNCIDPWIGACFSSYDGTHINKKDLSDLWEIYIQKNNLTEKSFESIWSALIHYAGDRSGKTISLESLRIVLDVAKPPEDFCSPYVGNNGPIIGTIHAAKGRENKEVHLNIRDHSYQSDVGEEIRVLYVGATRAKNVLCVGVCEVIPNLDYLPNGNTNGNYKRIYTKPSSKSDPRIQCEVGVYEDIGAESLAGKRYFSESELIGNQKSLLNIGRRLINGRALYDKTEDFFRIHSGADAATLAAFSDDFQEDLNEVKKRCNLGFRDSPDKISGFQIFGTRTIVVKPRSPELSLLHQPWSERGFMLAPVVFGFPDVEFRKI
jgi:hypothetical protein